MNLIFIRVQRNKVENKHNFEITFFLSRGMKCFNEALYYNTLNVRPSIKLEF